MILAPIVRNFAGDPNIVSLRTSNTYAEITAPGYLTSEPILSQIIAFNNGDFEWQDRDFIFVYQENNFMGLFTYDIANDTLRDFVSSGGSFEWEPTATFLTPGDLSVVYELREGKGVTIGPLTVCKADLKFTPTYTTSSGLFVIAGFPSTVLINFGGTIERTADGGSTPIIYPTGRTFLNPVPFLNQTYAGIRAFGDNVDDLLLTVDDILAGQTYFIRSSFIYMSG